MRPVPGFLRLLAYDWELSTPSPYLCFLIRVHPWNPWLKLSCMLATPNFRLSFKSVFTWSLKWSRIVSIAVCTFVVVLGSRFFWPCGPCLAFCDLWLTTGLASPSPPAYFKRTLKWPRIVSIAVCALVKALSSFGCGSLVLGLFASNLPLPTFDSVHHPRPSVKSVS